jgi:hypothetical protein
MRRFLLYTLMGLMALTAQAQQFTGLSGLLQTPSGEMYPEGTALVGGSFLNKHLTPDAFSFRGKYHTANYYLAVTPFRWVEVAFTCTLMKNYRRDGHANLIDDGSTRYYYQDRYFSLKLQPLREGRYWPSITLGANDPIGTKGSGNAAYSTGDEDTASTAKGDGKSQYFSNYFAAASKHFETRAGEWGAHLAYRHYKRPYNAKWNGVTAGVTYRPAFARDLRAVAEYTGQEVNVGADWLLWKHLLVQGILQDGKHLSATACLRMNLF